MGKWSNIKPGPNQLPLFDDYGQAASDPMAIRSLTWKEPFASLMLQGKVETRSWDTDYRGQVLIVAAKSTYSESVMAAMCTADQLVEIASKLSEKGTLPGYAIAVAELYHTRPMAPSDEVHCYVKHRDGLVCHLYRNVRPIIPFKFKGHQGWRNLPETIWQQITFLEDQPAQVA